MEILGRIRYTKSHFSPEFLQLVSSRATFLGLPYGCTYLQQAVASSNAMIPSGATIWNLLHSGGLWHKISLAIVELDVITLFVLNSEGGIKRRSIMAKHDFKLIVKEVRRGPMPRGSEALKGHWVPSVEQQILLHGHIARILSFPEVSQGSHATNSLGSPNFLPELLHSSLEINSLLYYILHFFARLEDFPSDPILNNASGLVSSFRFTDLIPFCT